MANQVLEIIRQRHHSGSKPGHRSDNFKVGLAVEGGGLRGIVSGGALSALEALNLKDAFDVIYGSSSGAYSASFFASGNTPTGCRFFLDYSQVQFVSLKRFLRGGHLFDLDYVEQMMHSATPLNYHKVVESKPPLHVVATDALHSHPTTIKSYRDTGDVDRALKASATLPVVKHPRPLLFRHRRFLDAAFIDPFCLHSAIAEGCTHILVLFSMPWRHRHPRFQILDRKLVAPYVAKISPHLAEVYLHHSEYSVNGLSHIWNHYDGTHILAVAPRKDAKLPGQLTTDRKRLGRGYLAGAEAALHTFSPSEKTSAEILANLRQELHI